MRGFFALLLLVSAAPAPALAEDEREFCADRPGLGTPPCIIDRGRLMVETGLADWTRARDPVERTDTLAAGDFLLRYGVTDRLEVQAGWTAFGRQAVRDRTTGAIDHSSGVGDITLAVRRNLSHPDGEGSSIALMPYVTLPTGGAAIGAGDWSAGLIAPMSFALSSGMKVEVMPEVDATADEDRHGRHLAYGGVTGLSMPINEAVTATGELSLFRDDDPGGHETHALAGLSIGWQPSTNLQIDGGANLGLNRTSDDVKLYVGVARRF